MWTKHKELFSGSKDLLENGLEGKGAKRAATKYKRANIWEEQREWEVSDTTRGRDGGPRVENNILVLSRDTEADPRRQRIPET